MRTLLFILLLLPVCAGAQIITTVVGNGTAGFAGDGGPAINASMDRPNCLAFDGVGNMYISDGGNKRVRKISATGIITTIAGNGSGTYNGDGMPATDAAISPLSIAADSVGNVYISEQFRIRKVSMAGIITTVAGTGAFGYNGDGIPATDAKVSSPYLGFIDEAGALYFSDHDNHRIRRIDPSGAISTIAGNGSSAFTGNGAALATGISGPLFLSRDNNGSLYFPDVNQRRVWSVDALGNAFTFSGTGAGGTGADGVPATATPSAQSSNLVADGEGNVYVAAGSSNKIRKINATGIITTIAGSLTSGFAGDGGPASAAQFDDACHMVYKNGSLYIADRYNNRIRRIALNTTEAGSMVTSVPAIYPVPATVGVTIRSDQQIGNLQIIDAAGQPVAWQMEGAVNRKQVRIDVSAFAAGVYIVRVNGAYFARFIKE